MEKAVSKFNYTVAQDERKNRLCKENNVPVLRIKYTKFKFIDAILEEYLNECTGKEVC